MMMIDDELKAGDDGGKGRGACRMRDEKRPAVNGDVVMVLVMIAQMVIKVVMTYMMVMLTT